MRGIILLIDSMLAMLLTSLILSHFFSIQTIPENYEDIYYSTISRDLLRVLEVSGKLDEILNLSLTDKLLDAKSSFKTYMQSILPSDLNLILSIDVYNYIDGNFYKILGEIFTYPGTFPVSEEVYVVEDIKVIGGEKFAKISLKLWRGTQNLTIVKISTFLDAGMQYPSIHFSRGDDLYYFITLVDRFGNPVRAKIYLMIIDPKNEIREHMEVEVIGAYFGEFNFGEDAPSGSWKIVV
ncbi:MAG: hypothetical protein QW507_00895, partial [Candidatus Nanoarchaeia archaeon]|nr:hypothetical protein [Candidatus Haiyanarchaeum thermophilum]MCW1308554.1 hypothetical protein [Candidatus Haiyanarchaeum thermophilum]